MSKTLTKEDLKLIDSLIGKQSNQLRKEMTENTREIIQHFNQSQSQLRQDMRKDTAKMLAIHHEGLTEAITKAIIDDKLKSFESEMSQLRNRVELLESR